MNLDVHVLCKLKRYQVSNYHIKLELNTHGMAMLYVNTQDDLNVNDSIFIFIEYKNDSQEELIEYFVGYIFNSERIGKNEIKLLCVQMMATLTLEQTISLRHTDMMQLLDEMTKETELDFYTGYSENTIVPYFYSLSTGYKILETIGEVFNIDDYIFFQEFGTTIYIGDWKDTAAYKKKIHLPDSIFIQKEVDNRAYIVIAPWLRPAAHCQLGMIHHTEIKQGKMLIKWTPK